MKIILFLILFLSIAFSQSSRDNYKYNYAKQLLKAGKTEESLKLYKELYTKSSSNVNYYNGYKNALLSLNKFPDAIKVIEFRKMNSGKNVQVYIDLAVAYFQFSKLDEAFATWKEATEFPANNQFQFVQIANSMVKVRAYDKAIDVYIYAQKKLTNKKLFVFEIARFYQYRMSYDKSFLEYVNSLNHFPKRYSFIRRQIFQMLESPDGKKQIIEKLSDLNDSKFDHLRLKADIYLKGKEYKHAFEIYKRPEFIGNKVLYNFAREASKMNQFGIVLDVCKLILNDEALKTIHINTQILQAKTLLKTYKKAPSDSLISVIDSSLPEIVKIRGRGDELTESYISHLIYERNEIERSREFVNLIQNKMYRHFYFAEGYFYEGDFDKAKKSYKNSRHPKFESKKLSRILIMTLLFGNDIEFKPNLNKLFRLDGGLKNPFLNNALKLMVDKKSVSKTKDLLMLYGEIMYSYALNKKDLTLVKIKKLSEKVPSFKLKGDRLIFDLLVEKREMNEIKTLIHSYENTQWAPEWNVRLAKLYVSENRQSDAKKILNTIILSYPISFWATEARQLLRTI